MLSTKTSDSSYLKTHKARYGGVNRVIVRLDALSSNGINRGMFDRVVAQPI